MSRYGIYAISIATLYDYFVETDPAACLRFAGGLYVNINGDALRGLRERRSMSLGDLGQVLGVSRRTISKYESRDGYDPRGCDRIEEFFDTGVVESIDTMRREPPKAMARHVENQQGPGSHGIP